MDHDEQQPPSPRRGDNDPLRWPVGPPRGRGRGPGPFEEEIAGLRRKGYSLRRIAAIMGVGVGTVRGALRRLGMD